tara:strand:- start:89 stop:1192 length:1104 start_codon:yes stop_codon:yes gene_type:complete
MATKKPVIQGGGPNYLGKQKMVTAPKKWKSSPTHPEAHLAYITDAEQDLLIKKDLYGSLKGKPNRGPSGIVSLQGDLGGYSGGQGGGKSGGGEGKGGGGSRSTPWRDTKQYEVLTRGQYNPKTQSFKDDRIARGARGAWSSPHLNPDAQQFGFDARQINKRRGIGGLLGALGRGALSFFGGVPGKIMSGIMTAKNWAGNQGSNLWSGAKDFGEGVKEFGEHDNLMSYLNRNKVQAIEPIAQDPDLYTDEMKEFRMRNPLDLTNANAANTQGVNQNLPLYPNVGLGAAEGGRIGFKDGTNWYDRVYPFDIMPWPIKDLAEHFGQIKKNDPSTWVGGMTGKSLGILDKRNKRLKLALENKAEGGIARLL